MLGKMYPSWVERTAKEQDGWTAPFVALLLKDTYTYSGTHVFLTDVSAEELAGGTGYARVAPAGLAVTRSGSVTSVTFSAITFANLVAVGAGVAPASMVVARNSGSDASSPLIFQQDFQGRLDVNGASVTITPSPQGFVRYTSSP
jgi:hypothetical protein